MGHGHAPTAVGTILQDRYEIIAELGVGGFGAVYKAQQVATGQPVAVKVLHARGQDGSSAENRIARF